MHGEHGERLTLVPGRYHDQESLLPLPKPHDPQKEKAWETPTKKQARDVLILMEWTETQAIAPTLSLLCPTMISLTGA